MDCIFCCIAGLFAFQVNIIAGSWIKYAPYAHVSIAATTILAAAILYLVQLHLRWAPYLTSKSHPSMEPSDVSG